MFMKTKQAKKLRKVINLAYHGLLFHGTQGKDAFEQKYNLLLAKGTDPNPNINLDKGEKKLFKIMVKIYSKTQQYDES